MKIIAFYLPQFYTFPENDAWWGKGFTEWTNTRKAVPQFQNHYQPRVPYRDNYYTLTNSDAIAWQIAEAKKYGIYAFCFYHYWFANGKKLLEKPVELFLKNKDLNMNFCLSWANEPWTRSWDGEQKQIIMPQEYGGEKEWRDHFFYLLDFFRDERYIKIKNRPLFVFYRPEIFPEFEKMISLWNIWAVKEGFDGICLATQGPKWNVFEGNASDYVDYKIMYEPGYTGELLEHQFDFKLAMSKGIRKIDSLLTPGFHGNKFSYRAYCENIISRKMKSCKEVPGFFVDWDNTARRGNSANVFLGSSPDVFGQYLTKLIVKCRNEYHKNTIFINAWNEWAEGCYLEPDQRYGMKYLEALKNALNNCNEFPSDFNSDIESL